MEEKKIEVRRVDSSSKLPSVRASGIILRRDRELEFETPIGNFGGTGVVQGRAEMVVVQPIYRPGVLGPQKESAKLNAESESLKKERVSQLLYGNAIKAYAQLNEVEIRIASLKEFIAKLRRQKAEIQRIYDLGRVTELDLVKVKISISSAESDLFTLKKVQDSAKSALGFSLGLNQAVQSRSIQNIDERLPIVTGNSTEKRFDTLALEKTVESLDNQRKGINQSYRPQLDAIGNATWERPTAFNNDTSLFIGAQLTWNLFNANQRKFERQKVKQKKESVEALLKNQIQSVQVERDNARNTLLSLINEKRQRKQDYERAKYVVRVESQRYFNGRSSLNELLDAEFLLQQRREEHDVQPYRILAAWSTYAVASGGSIFGEFQNQLGKVK